MRPVVGYLSGPVDAREVYANWRRGEPTAYFGTSYLQQFFSTVTDLGAAGHVITSHDGDRYDVQRGNFVISNRPRVGILSGWQYHFREFKWIISALRSLQIGGSRVIVLTDAQNYWAMTFALRINGTKFVNALHCAIRPAFKSEPKHLSFLLWAAGSFHYIFGDETLCASPLIERQVRQMPGYRKRNAVRFLPTYKRHDFAEVPPLPIPFRLPSTVLYAGRIEENKGVFDLLDAAVVLVTRHGPKAIVFDVCGEGTALPALRSAIAARGMSDCFRVHGFCNRAKLVGHFASADLIVVPTRTDFEEGFAMIVAEGVLAGRPVVTSRVCPALELVSEACVEVEPDDPIGYADAISRLLTDPDLSSAKKSAASELREQFFDNANSYRAKLSSALEVILQNRE